MSNWTRKEKHCDTIISKVKGFKFMGPNDDKLMINQLTLTNEYMKYYTRYRISSVFMLKSFKMLYLETFVLHLWFWSSFEKNIKEFVV